MKTILKLLLGISVFCLCSCSKDVPAVYEVVGMSISNLSNTGQNPTDAITDSVPKKAYAIKMTLNEVMKTKAGGDPQDNGFTNEDKLSSLNIYSLYSFDAAHPAGTSLNSYFLTQLTSSGTIDAFVAKGQIGGGKYKDGNYIDSWSTDQYLYLMTAPTAQGYQSFVVEMGLSDGRSFSDTVTVILF